MSYFAANKLRNWLSVIVLILFTLVCALFILQINLVRNEMAQLYLHVQQMKDAQALAWFGKNPYWAIVSLTYLHHIVTIGGYLGSIAFFTYKRKLDEGT